MRILFFAVLLLAGACGPAKRLFVPEESPHARYAAGLDAARLSGTALGRQWTAAGNAALQRPVTVVLPHRETGFFAPDKPGAAGLRFGAPRGQKIRIVLTTRPDTGAALFMELWREQAGGAPQLVQALERRTDTLMHEVSDDGERFILRLQPELLAAVSYTLTITGAPSFGFPVRGGAPRDIGSIWGDPRDAGARRHEGIDIFGKKRTPVVAAVAGTVTRVQETGRGGKVVWLRPDDQPLSLYYAHLDSQLVQPGASVAAGTVLGLMGNTGNARSTPTHLHFGIYGAGGAANPYYYVAGATGEAAAVTGTLPPFDSLLRTGTTASLLSSPADKSGTVLPSGSAVSVRAVAATHCRVALPDGREGWLRREAVVSATASLRRIRLPEKQGLLYRPQADAAVVAQVPAGSTVQVLAGADGGWTYGRSEAGAGWFQPQP